MLADITNMTEEKIEKIQDYIKTHSCSDCQSDDSGVSTPSPRKSKKVLIFFNIIYIILDLRLLVTIHAIWSSTIEKPIINFERGLHEKWVTIQTRKLTS